MGTGSVTLRNLASQRSFAETEEELTKSTGEFQSGAFSRVLQESESSRYRLGKLERTERTPGMKLRLLVLHSELGVLRGGGENFTRNLIRQLSSRGHEISVAFTANLRGRYPLALPTGVNPLPVRGWWSMNLGQEFLSAFGRTLPAKGRLRSHWDRVRAGVGWRTFKWHNQRFARKVEGLLADRWQDYDAVYVHGDTRLASSLAARLPTVLRLPGPISSDLQPLLERISAVCANGDALARIRNFMGDRVLELPVGLDEDRFKPGPSFLRPGLGWGEEDLVVGYVGRLAHLKGVDLLAEAFREVSQQQPRARLLLVGHGEEEHTLRRVLASELSQRWVHIQESVEHEELPAWYRAMDLLVMPSRYENFSNAVLEAMACGVPLLASDIGGNRVLASAGGGWLFKPGSFESLAERLRDILGNPQLLKARGAQGSEFVRGRYNWSHTARCLEDIIGSRLRLIA